jgi:uncharacterized membrane protein YgdD (TMEM256/DUF423 family)
MKSVLLAVGAINAALAVAAGAFAAHGLRSRLEPRALEIFETGARYHMYHALGMILCAALAAYGIASARTAGWLLQAGIAIFSGSLYALALTDIKILGAITPAAPRSWSGGCGWLSARFAETDCRPAASSQLSARPAKFR